jgi:hypothetical protein
MGIPINRNKKGKFEIKPGRTKDERDEAINIILE